MFLHWRGVRRGGLKVTERVKGTRSGKGPEGHMYRSREREDSGKQGDVIAVTHHKELIFKPFPFDASTVRHLYVQGQGIKLGQGLFFEGKECARSQAIDWRNRNLRHKL